MKASASVLMGVGVLFLFLGRLWPDRSPAAVWTADQANQRRDAFIKAHNARGAKAAQEKNKADAAHDTHAAEKHDHGPPLSDAEFEATEEQVRQSNADIEAARRAANLPARLFFWSGLLAVLAGLGGYGYVRATKG